MTSGKRVANVKILLEALKHYAEPFDSAKAKWMKVIGGWNDFINWALEPALIRAPSHDITP